MRNASRSSPSLLCQETAAVFSESEEVEFNYPIQSFEIEDEEYVKVLLQKERGFEFGCYAECEINNKSWMKCGRLDSIEWIFNTGEKLGFQIHTAYLSITFLDRFLSKRTINEEKIWAFPLLSVACLSLAAKMEETDVPLLSEFPMKEFNVENTVIQKMELLVLVALEWKMDSITPFSYLHYFVCKICVDFRPKDLVSRAVKLILASIKDISFLDYRPSVIAAASVLAAFDDKLTRKALEMKMEFISVDNEDVYSCYNRIKRIEGNVCKTPRADLSSDSNETVENRSVFSRARAKRKLAFSDFEEGLEKRKSSVMVIGD